MIENDDTMKRILATIHLNYVEQFTSFWRIPKMKSKKEGSVYDKLCRI